MNARLMCVLIAIVLGGTIVLTSFIYMYNFRLVEIEYVKQRMLQGTR